MLPHNCSLLLITNLFLYHVVEEKDFDESQPMVDGNSQDAKLTSSKLDDPILHQEQAIGAPTHYHTDGSYLYMLTPAFLPPSTDDVNKWLLNDTGTANF